MELAIKVAADRRWWESYLALGVVLALSLTACGEGAQCPPPECYRKIDDTHEQLIQEAYFEGKPTPCACTGGGQ
jgi:hypothetical protein